MLDPGFAFQMGAVVAGAVGGTLLGIAGGIGGDLARRGERRRWIDLVFGMVMVLGGITAVSGLVAGGLNQPATIWLGLLGVGVVLIFLARKMNRHLDVIRAEAPSSRIIIPGESDQNR